MKPFGTPNETRTRIFAVRGQPPTPISMIGASFVVGGGVEPPSLHYE